MHTKSHKFLTAKLSAKENNKQKEEILPKFGEKFAYYYYHYCIKENQRASIKERKYSATPMDIKQNIQKAVEDGGYIDLRRIQKANSQLEYQPNQIQFYGGSTNDQQGDTSENEEYKQMIQKQRDIDHKSDKLVSSSMEIYKKYTSSYSQNVELKVRRLRQDIKRSREDKRFVTDSIEQIPTDAELKKKFFIFPPLERQKVKEGQVQKINSRSQMRDDLETIQGASLENTKRSSTNNQPQVQEQNQQVKVSTLVEDKQKFDFHQINNKVQSKKRENVINKQIGNLPREIQAISELVEDSKEEKDAIQQPIFYDKFERSKVDVVQGDLVESFSMAYIYPKNNIQKSTHNLCFFRDLAPISRFLMKFTNIQLTAEQRYQNKLNDDYCNSELIQADEIFFDIKNLQYSNIADIISGRIGDEQLSKFDTSTTSIEDLPPKVQQKVQELIKQSIEAQLKNFPIQTQSVISQQQTEPESKKKLEGLNTQLSKEQIKNQLKQKSSQDQVVQIDQPLNQSSYSPKSLGMSKNQAQEMTVEQKRTHQQIMTLHNQTDQILNKIGEIKQKKEDMKYIRDPQEHLQKYKELKKELQQALNGLLYMILKTENNPNPQINNKYTELDQQVSQLLKNLDKIQGTKTSDGHLKSVLLLTFLEEYKWITQEDQLHKMDFDSNNQKASQRQPNTFPNYLHNGQQTKPNTKSNSNTLSPSPLISQRQETIHKNNNNMNSSFSSSKNMNYQNKKNSKSTNTAIKENISKQTNKFQNQSGKSNLNQQNFNANSSSFKYAEFGGIDTTNSFYQQTPGKNNKLNGHNLTERSYTPNSTLNKSNNSVNNSFMKSQSALSQNRSKSPIYNNNNNNNNRTQPLMNKSTSSIQQSNINRQKAAITPRSKSPIVSKDGIIFSGNGRQNNKSTTPKKNILEGNIPGIKKGQNSILNNSYLKNTSFTSDNRPNTFRK